MTNPTAEVNVERWRGPLAISEKPLGEECK